MRNLAAKALADHKFKQRILRNRKLYSRKQKHKNCN